MFVRLTIFLIAGVVLSGCATAPNPWQDLTVDTSPAATPIDCGSFPYPTGVQDESIIYDNAGVNDLERYRECSEANEAIAQEHALQIGYLKQSRYHLVEAGKAQKSIADMRQTMLEDERKHRFWSSIGYWIVIIGLGSAL